MVEKILEKELKKIISQKKKVVSVYTSPTCEICKMIIPELERLCKTPTYSDIYFVEIDSTADPQTIDIIVPFISNYKNGLLVECGTVLSIAEVNVMLNKLML